jgi:phosphoglycerate kinase
VIAASKKTAIVGGGDVVASIEKLNLMNKFTFVSSGGGAMLSFLADETLVGLEAIKNANHKVSYSPTAKGKGLFALIRRLF